MSKRDFQSLTIKDSFMFYAVMTDAGQCRRLLTMVLEMEIESVTVCCEDTLTYHPDYHGVRLDVLARENGTKRRFNVEMQAQKETDIARRSRYYHSQLDTDALLTGSPYGDLPDTYVIFICDFDPFGREFYRYEFSMIGTLSGQRDTRSERSRRCPCCVIFAPRTSCTRRSNALQGQRLLLSDSATSVVRF